MSYCTENKQSDKRFKDSNVYFEKLTITKRTQQTDLTGIHVIKRFMDLQHGLLSTAAGYYSNTHFKTILRNNRKYSVYLQ